MPLRGAVSRPDTGVVTTDPNPNPNPDPNLNPSPRPNPNPNPNPNPIPNQVELCSYRRNLALQSPRYTNAQLAAEIERVTLPQVGRYREI